MEDFMPPPKKSKPSAFWAEFGADVAKRVREEMAKNEVKKARTCPPPDVYCFDLERYVSGYLAQLRLRR